MRQSARDRLLNRLPKIPLAQIGGQTLEQAVAEPAGANPRRRRHLAPRAGRHPGKGC